MRIAIVNQPWDGSLPPKQTSLAIWSYQVARCLSQSCEVIVYGRECGRGRKVEDLEGVRYHHVAAGLDRRLLRVLEPLSGLRSARRPLVASSLYYRGYIHSVAADLRDHPCDLVLLFNFSQFVPVIHRCNPRITIALNMQCEWLTQFDRAMIQRRLRSVDWIVGCSAYIADKVGRRFPDLANRCRPLFNGVDVGEFGGDGHDSAPTPKAGKRLLFVGRVSPEKGLHVLLEAFRKVLQRHPESRLEIVGADAPCPREYIVDLADDERVAGLARFYDGKGYFAHLQDQIESAGIVDHVTFRGFVPHAGAIEHYRQADVLVNPSLSEAFGMSLVEGMASGIPVVATQVGGMPEIVEEGETGLLVEPDDAPALAEALISILDDDELARSMGEAGRRRAAELFSWERIAENVRALCVDDECQ